MGKFNKSGGREMPELNTASLPDLVFAFLFFIMMVTTMREVTLKVFLVHFSLLIIFLHSRKPLQCLSLKKFFLLRQV